LCTVEEIEAADFSQDKAYKAKNEDLSVFKIKPSASFEIGEDFKICGKVAGNMSQILDFELPFKGANTRPAELSFSSLKLGSTSKQGFIKLRVKKGGNLFGINLVNTGNSKEPDHVFPAFEVKCNFTHTMAIPTLIYKFYNSILSINLRVYALKLPCK